MTPRLDNRSLRNRPADRVYNVVMSPTSNPGQFFTPGGVAEIVASGTLPELIEAARETERAARETRLWLESLAGKGELRTCPVCGSPLMGRADRVFCSSTCRQRQHRSSRMES